MLKATATQAGTPTIRRVEEPSKAYLQLARTQALLPRRASRRRGPHARRGLEVVVTSTTFVHDIRESEPFAVGSERKLGRGLTVDLAEAIIGEGPPPQRGPDPLRQARAGGSSRSGHLADVPTLRRHGTDRYTLLALKRWDRITAEDLDRARVIGQDLAVNGDAA
jgi:hypothetical protein